VQDELYSIGREALPSAVRHAQATEIALELNYDVMQKSWFVAITDVDWKPR
jgi:signal transduction histidine kinase